VVYLKPKQLLIKDCARRFVLKLWTWSIVRPLCDSRASCLLLISVYSPMRARLCRKQTCTVTVIHYCTDDCQLLIAHCSSHLSDSQIFVQNRDFRVPDLHWRPREGVPVGILQPIIMLTRKCSIFYSPMSVDFTDVQIVHLTHNMLLHYLVKFENPKLLPNFHVERDN